MAGNSSLHLARALPHVGVSSSSRLGASSTAGMSPGSERWSATEKARNCSSSSPKNSTRTGGRRRREDVEDAAAHGELAAAGDHVDARVGELDEPVGELGEVVAAAAVGESTGSMSARPAASGCRAARTEAMTTRGDRARPTRRFAERARRRPTVSALGLRRSCGRVSHAGKSSTVASGTWAARAGPRDSARRPVGVIASSTAADRPAHVAGAARREAGRRVRPRARTPHRRRPPPARRGRTPSRSSARTIPENSHRTSLRLPGDTDAARALR